MHTNLKVHVFSLTIQNYLNQLFSKQNSISHTKLGLHTKLISIIVLLVVPS